MACRGLPVRMLRFCFLVLLSPLASGCSGGNSAPTGEVAGKVTFAGKPVAEGSIAFFDPETGFGAEATLAADGSYTLRSRGSGVPVGTYKVTITPPIYIDRSDPRTSPGRAEKQVDNIPEDYRRIGTTTLRAEVKEGKNDLNFNMQP